MRDVDMPIHRPIGFPSVRHSTVCDCVLYCAKGIWMSNFLTKISIIFEPKWPYKIPTVTP